MNVKKAVVFGVILWVLIFFEVSFLMFGFNLKAGDNGYYIAHYLLSSIFVIILSGAYFKTLKENNVKGKKVKAKKEKIKGFSGLYDGMLVGIVFVGTGLILDAIITVPLFVKSYDFFVDVALIISYLLTVVLSMVVGYVFTLTKK